MRNGMNVTITVESSHSEHNRAVGVYF